MKRLFLILTALTLALNLTCLTSPAGAAVTYIPFSWDDSTGWVPQVKMIDSLNGYCRSAGTWDKYTLYVTNNGGADWRTVNEVATGATNTESNVYALLASNRLLTTMGFVGWGINGYAAMSIDGGLTWTEQSDPIQNLMGGYAYPIAYPTQTDYNTFVLVGEHREKIAYLPRNSSTWSLLDASVFNASATAGGPYLYVWTEEPAYSGNYELWSYDDRIGAWLQAGANLPATFDLTGAWAWYVADNGAITLVDRSSSTEHPARSAVVSTNGGQSWATVYYSPTGYDDDDFYIDSAMSTDGTTVYLSGRYRYRSRFTIRRSTNGGASYETLETQDEDRYVTFATDEQGTVHGFKRSTATYTPYIFGRYDFGGGSSSCSTTFSPLARAETWTTVSPGRSYTFRGVGYNLWCPQVSEATFAAPMSYTATYRNTGATPTGCLLYINASNDLAPDGYNVTEGYEINIGHRNGTGLYVAEIRNMYLTDWSYVADEIYPNGINVFDGQNHTFTITVAASGLATVTIDGLTAATFTVSPNLDSGRVGFSAMDSGPASALSLTVDNLTGCY